MFNAEKHYIHLIPSFKSEKKSERNIRNYPERKYIVDNLSAMIKSLSAMINNLFAMINN